MASVNCSNAKLMSFISRVGEGMRWTCNIQKGFHLEKKLNNLTVVSESVVFAAETMAARDGLDEVGLCVCFASAATHIHSAVFDNQAL